MDYFTYSVPDEKDVGEYNHNERRATILKRIEQKGHPDGFNHSELGREFGVTHTTINKDFGILKEFYQENIGTDAKTTSELAYTKIVRDHLENDDLEKARKALDSWNEWLFNIGAQDKAPDKKELTGEDGGPLMILEGGDSPDGDE